MNSRRITVIAQIAAFLTAIGVIAYKTISFQDWDSMISELHNFGMKNMAYMSIVLIVMPLNLISEAIKWRRLLLPIHNISYSESIFAVLAGLSGALSTPNRIGDIPMRALLLPVQYRKRAVILGFTGSFAMNAVVAAVGIAAIPLYLMSYGGNKVISGSYIAVAVTTTVLLIVMLFSLPSLALRISALVKTKGNGNLSHKFVKALQTMSVFSRRQMLSIMAISLLRYFIFTSQYYLMLLAFNAGISPFDAMSTIPIIYLLSTITPMISATEAVTRSGYALLLFTPFNIQAPEILFATMSLWIVNNAVPTITGIGLYRHFHDKKTFGNSSNKI